MDPFAHCLMGLLSACQQSDQMPNAEVAVSDSTLSTANTVDISADLKLLDQVANTHSAAMVNMQDVVNTALENKDQKAFPILFEQLEKYVVAFNDGLDQTKYKSKEVKSVSEIFKQVHLLSLDLTKEKMQDSPDQVRIDELKDKLDTLQRSAIVEIQRLQFLVYKPSEIKTTNDPAMTPTPATTALPLKESDHVVEAAKQLSQNNMTDIKVDLAALMTPLTMEQANINQLMMKMQDASQNKNTTELKTVVTELQKRLQLLNQKYDAVGLKSSEMSAIRLKMKKENQVQIELSEIILSPVPDKNKFAQLQQELTQANREVKQEMINLQQKLVIR